MIMIRGIDVCDRSSREQFQEGWKNKFPQEVRNIEGIISEHPREKVGNQFRMRQFGLLPDR